MFGSVPSVDVRCMGRRRGTAHDTIGFRRGRYRRQTRRCRLAERPSHQFPCTGFFWFRRGISSRRLRSLSLHGRTATRARSRSGTFERAKSELVVGRSGSVEHSRSRPPFATKSESFAYSQCIRCVPSRGRGRRPISRWRRKNLGGIECRGRRMDCGSGGPDRRLRSTRVC